MRTFISIAVVALALGTFGCAAPEPEPTTEASEGAIDEEAAALRVGGGGTLPDRDTCEAMKAGCYKSCNGNASCLHSCDITYAQCRGLPPPMLGYAR